MTDIGYARVSTREQNLDLQMDALTAAGCERTFQDKASGKLDSRPGLDAALDYARPGDRLTVWKLDRLGRSVAHLVTTVCELQDRGVEFRSLTDQIDTSTASGKLIFHVFCALAEFYADLGAERTKAGLDAARARGRVGGRRAVMTQDKVRAAQQMRDSGGFTGQQIADTLGVSRAALYRALPRRDTTTA